LIVVVDAIYLYMELYFIRINATAPKPNGHSQCLTSLHHVDGHKDTGQTAAKRFRTLVDTFK